MNLKRASHISELLKVNGLPKTQLLPTTEVIQAQQAAA